MLVCESQHVRDIARPTPSTAGGATADAGWREGNMQLQPPNDVLEAACACYYRDTVILWLPHAADQSAGVQSAGLFTDMMTLACT